MARDDAKPDAVKTYMGPEDARLVRQWLFGRRPTTIVAYEEDVSSFAAFVRKPMAACSLDDLQAWSKSLRGVETGRARRMSAVRSLFSWAFKAEHISRNVASLLKMPKGRNRLADRILTEKQVKALKKAAAESGPRDGALVAFLYETGCRRAELCGVKWEHISPGDDGAAHVTLFGKGAKTRSVPIGKKMLRDLQALRPDDTLSSSYVFAGRDGELDARTIWKIVRTAAVRAKLGRGASPHWLRHAHASHALERGASIALVGATLGHASLSTTGRYLHIRPGDSSGRYLRV